MQGRARDAGAFRKQIDRWMADLSSGAEGWLGSTGGVSDDGRFVTVVRFSSEQAARANSERHEQDAWWQETSKQLESPEFHDASRVTEVLGGGSDAAGFVREAQEGMQELQSMLSDRRFTDLREPRLLSPR